MPGRKSSTPNPYQPPRLPPRPATDPVVLLLAAFHVLAVAVALGWAVAQVVSDALTLLSGWSQA